MEQTIVHEIEECGYCPTLGCSTVKVTLRRGNMYVSCDDIAIWDEDACDLDETFDDWHQAVIDEQQGYHFYGAHRD